jgi:hypothetical protein
LRYISTLNIYAFIETHYVLSPGTAKEHSLVHRIEFAGKNKNSTQHTASADLSRTEHFKRKKSVSRNAKKNKEEGGVTLSTFGQYKQLN